MRFYFAAATCALGSLLACGLPSRSGASDVEKPSALNGSTYTVIAPLYDGSNGDISYLRFFNGNAASTTYSITVVNATSGTVVGTLSLQVPTNASPQYPLSPTGGTNSLFTQAGVTDSAGTSYALYIKDSDALAGFTHVTYNNTSLLFENNNSCSTTLNQQLAGSNLKALTNIHTSQLSGYPSVLSLANFAGTSTTVTLSVYDAANGNSLGQFNQTIAANETLTLPESQIETQLNFKPTSSQLHINVLFTNAAGGSLPVLSTHAIHNSQLQGDINMTSACAVNAVAG